LTGRDPIREGRVTRLDLQSWFRYRRLDGGLAPVRLFCFPYAGGGASVYRDWADTLAPSGIDVVAVQLPGREDRFCEPAFSRIEPLCEAVIQRLQPLLDRPFALFGHSMGAIIAYELARRFEEAGPKVTHLIVSGQRAPQVSLGRPVCFDLPTEAFHARLRELNGTPEAVLRDPEMMSLFSPLLRSDFELCETYPREQRPPLDCPITVLGGRDDSETDRAHLEAWRTSTRGAFRLEWLAGDHFFVQSKAVEVRRVVESALAGF
jgi:medium-chain acyl-[acyl-carrier-protein] hydrolase